MPIEIKRYALDPTGANPNNTVIGEIQTLNVSSIRALLPTYAPFYANERLQIWDNLTGRMLIRGVDYVVSEMLKDATLQYGQEICEVILITNIEVSSQVRLNYVALGGLYQSHIDAVVKAYEAFTSDARVVDYANVMNKPMVFKPALHPHLANDLYGVEELVASLERIRNAITLADVPAYETLVAWVKSRGMTLAEFKAGKAQDKFITGEILKYLFDKLGIGWPKEDEKTGMIDIMTACCIFNPKIQIDAQSLYMLGR